MFLIILLVLLVLIALYCISAYNSLVKGRNFVEEAFSTIDIYLKKRYDLIPNFVSTVKGYSEHESKTLEAVIAARNRYLSATTPNEKIENENMISGTLNRLFSLTEAYPELKANQNFTELQSTLKSIETDILQARKYYNGTARDYNISCENFPTVLIAKLFSFKTFPYYNIENKEERENVKVEF